VSVAKFDDDFINVLKMAETTSDDKTMETLNQTGTTPPRSGGSPAGALHPKTETERETSDIVQKLKDMPVGHRIRLAMLGDRVIRSILIRSTIRNISSAVLKNPGLSDQEVLTFAKSRSISRLYP